MKLVNAKSEEIPIENWWKAPDRLTSVTVYISDQRFLEDLHD